MKESEVLNIIQKTLSDSSYIGDDCAELKPFNLFITQDSLVEDVHFNLKTTTPYQLGIKAVAVNISDLLTRLSKPMFISVGLSLPKNITSDFISELYRGIDSVCLKYGVKVTGGDITGSEKVVISIAAIGKRDYKYNTSRAFAKEGDYIVTTGFYGASSAGLYALQNGISVSEKLTNACFTPQARFEEAEIMKNIADCDLASADTSDGLADTLFKIADASGVCITVNYENIPVLSQVRDFAKQNNLDEKQFVLWGGEDFELIFCVSEETFNKLDHIRFKFIGRVENRTDTPRIKIICGETADIIDKNTVDNKTFNHFGG